MAFQSSAPVQRWARLEDFINRVSIAGLIVVAIIALATAIYRVPELQHQAAQVPTLRHIASREHARAVEAEKDRDEIVRAIDAVRTPAVYDDPPIPKPKPGR